MKTRHQNEAALIIFSYFSLLIIGLLEVWASSHYFAYKHFDDGDFIFRHDLIYVILSLSAALLFHYIDYNFLKKISKALIVIAIILLLMLFVGPGVYIRGATRWLRLGVQFEPSEFAKLALLIYIADFISRKRDYVKDYARGFLPPAIIVGIIFLLIASEPDVGTAFLVFLVAFLMLYVANYKTAHISTIAFPSILVLGLAVYTHPEKLGRMTHFLSSNGISYQVQHSMIAIGSGGLFGQGLGGGLCKMLFLPDSYNDFILSGIGEDLGFVGIFVTVVLLFMMVYLIFSLSLKCSDIFGKMLLAGIGTLLSLQMIINMGSVFNLTPPKGMSMPFLSYGGTNLIIEGVMIGIVLNIARSIRD